VVNQEEPPAPAALLTPEVRQRLMAQFAQWLDRIAVGEPPPEGLPAELLADVLAASDQSVGIESDLYAVVSALTKLSGEVGLQGRAFRQVTEALAPLSQLPGRLERLETAQILVAEELARHAEEAPDDAGLPDPRELLSLFFDLYDRLERGLRTFEASVEALKQESAVTGWRGRLLGGKALAERVLSLSAAIREGYQLTLSRLEGALRQWDVHRFGAIGEPFDPVRMNVIEVQPCPDRPDGTVLEVYKSGYSLHGKLLATAQVKVCRRI
jgi:hypothetical protein